MDGQSRCFLWQTPRTILNCPMYWGAITHLCCEDCYNETRWLGRHTYSETRGSEVKRHMAHLNSMASATASRTCVQVLL